MPKKENVWDRLSRKLSVVPSGCWEFTGYRTRDGYGQISLNGRAVYTHRVVYEQLVGPIPDGLHVDHLCRNPSCCNPLHLEPVTCKENLARRVCRTGTRKNLAAEDTKYLPRTRTCAEAAEDASRAKRIDRGSTAVSIGTRSTWAPHKTAQFPRTA